jgi:predicted CopG family antitoxin
MPNFGTNIRVSAPVYHRLDEVKDDDESFDQALRRELGVD